MCLSPFTTFNTGSGGCCSVIKCFATLLAVSGGSGGSSGFVCSVGVASIGVIVILDGCGSGSVDMSVFVSDAVSTSCCTVGCVGIAWLLSPKFSLWWLPVEDAKRCLLRRGRRCRCCLCSVGGEVPALEMLEGCAGSCIVLSSLLTLWVSTEPFTVSSTTLSEIGSCGC